MIYLREENSIMKTVYKDRLYRVGFFTFFKIQIYKLILLLKRIKRFCKRILSYNLQLLIISLILSFLSVIFIVLGLKLQRYSSWLEGLWDFKDIFLTSIIITLIINTINKETTRHANLLEQLSHYEDLFFISEKYIKSILEIISITYDNHIFTTDEIHENFKNNIIDGDILKNNKLLDNLNIDIRKYFEFISNQYINRLFITKSYLIRIQGEDFSYYALDHMNDCIEEIEKTILKINHMKDEKVLKEIFDFCILISNIIAPIIISFRKPWRWDMKINNKIYKLLKNEGNIIEEFYYKNKVC